MNSYHKCCTFALMFAICCASAVCGVLFFFVLLFFFRPVAVVGRVLLVILYYLCRLELARRSWLRLLHAAPTKCVGPLCTCALSACGMCAIQCARLQQWLRYLLYVNRRTRKTISLFAINWIWLSECVAGTWTNVCGMRSFVCMCVSDWWVELLKPTYCR